MLEKVEAEKLYRNTKTGHLYKVIGIGAYTEAPMELVPMVFYQSMWKSAEPFWVRPYDLFLEKFEEVPEIQGTVFV